MAAHIGVQDGRGASARGFIRTTAEAARELRELKHRGLPTPDDLRAWRRTHRITAAKAAKLARLHPGHWSRWEANPRNPFWRPAPGYMPLLLAGLDLVLAHKRRPLSVTAYALKRWRSRFQLRITDAVHFIKHYDPDTWRMWERAGDEKLKKKNPNVREAPPHLALVLLGAEEELKRHGIVSGMLTINRAALKLGVKRQAVHLMIRDGKLRGAVQLPSGCWLIPPEALAPQPSVSLDSTASNKDGTLKGSP